MSNVIEQRKRHIRTNKHAIHPYSDFMIVYEIVMSLMALISLVKDPFLYAFDPNYNYETESTDGIAVHVLLNTIFDVLLMLLSLFNFFIGYMDKVKCEVVLDGRKIAKRYVTHYFLLDFCTVPLHVSYYWDKKTLATWYILRLIIWARIVRMITYERYLRQLTVKIGLGIFGHRVLTFFLWAVLMVHWINCLYCLYIKFLVDVKPELNDALVLQFSKIKSTSDHYIIALFITTAHLYSSGELLLKPSTPYEQMFMILVLAIGKCFVGIIVSQVFGMMRSTISSRAKYDALVNELKSYAKLKRLPIEIEARLVKYYRVRFNQKYFKETSILLQLTPTLIKEIKYLTTKLIIEKLPLFKGIPLVAIEDLVCKLTEDFYLENDVIGRYNTPCDCLNIIAYGTCALITDDNEEIVHFDDGGHFGVVPILCNDGMYENNVVAVTHCQIYKMSKDIFYHFLRNHPSFRLRMEEEIDNINRLCEKRKSHVDDQVTIINQLRNNMILEGVNKRN